MRLREMTYLVIILFLLVVGVNAQIEHKPRRTIRQAFSAFVHSAGSLFRIRRLVRDEGPSYTPSYQVLPAEPFQEPVRYLASDGTPIINHGEGW